ncbi:unnamed protein product [Lampetra fluviatilis]
MDSLALDRLLDLAGELAVAQNIQTQLALRRPPAMAACARVLRHRRMWWRAGRKRLSRQQQPTITAGSVDLLAGQGQGVRLLPVCKGTAVDAAIVRPTAGYRDGRRRERWAAVGGACCAAAEGITYGALPWPRTIWPATSMG